MGSFYQVSIGAFSPATGRPEECKGLDLLDSAGLEGPSYLVSRDDIHECLGHREVQAAGFASSYGTPDAICRIRAAHLPTEIQVDPGSCFTGIMFCHSPQSDLWLEAGRL